MTPTQYGITITYLALRPDRRVSIIQAAQRAYGMTLETALTAVRRARGIALRAAALK